MHTYKIALAFRLSGHACSPSEPASLCEVAAFVKSPAVVFNKNYGWVVDKPCKLATSNVPRRQKATRFYRSFFQTKSPQKGRSSSLTSG